MYKIDTTNFTIYYTNKSDEMVEELLNSLLVNMNRILQFFKLEELKNKTDIIIYSSIDDYIKHVNACNQTHYEWLIADTFDGKINILSIDICRKTDAHRNISIEEYSKLIIHEFVHICQQEVNPNSYGCEWFWEALATNLADQKMERPQEICTREALMFNYASIPNAYSISYYLGRYMLQNLSHEKIYEYVLKPEILWNDTETLLNEVRKEL